MEKKQNYCVQVMIVSITFKMAGLESAKGTNMAYMKKLLQLPIVVAITGLIPILGPGSIVVMKK